MDVRLNRPTPPADTAAKATAIARSGRAIVFTGDLRRLSKIEQLLAGEDGIIAHLVGPKGNPRLRVFPETGAGWVADRV